MGMWTRSEVAAEVPCLSKPPRKILGRARGARLLYLTPGGHHDSFFLQTLREAGFDVLYVHLMDGMGKYCPSDVESVNLGYRPILGNGAGRAIARMALKVPCLARVRHLLRQFRPDLLHADWIPTTGFWGALSGVHPFHLFCFGSDLRTRAERSWWLRRIAAFTLSRADVVTCDNEFTRSLIARRYRVPAHRLRCHSLGVDLSVFRPDPVARQFVRRQLRWGEAWIVLYARKLEDLYDPATFIRAVASASREEPALRALVTGEGPLRSKLQALAAELGVGDKIMFPENLDRAELARYVAASDAMVSCPTDDGSSIAVLEAMACGLPVVVSDLPAMREWVAPGVNGFLCPPGDVGSFSQALLRTRRDAVFRARVGPANRRLVEERADRAQSRDRLARTYLELLEEVSGGARREPVHG